MQTGQNSIAPENSLPQIEQVRSGSVLMGPEQSYGRYLFRESHQATGSYKNGARFPSRPRPFRCLVASACSESGAVCPAAAEHFRAETTCFLPNGAIFIAVWPRHSSSMRRKLKTTLKWPHWSLM